MLFSSIGINNLKILHTPLALFKIQKFRLHDEVMFKYFCIQVYQWTDKFGVSNSSGYCDGIRQYRQKILEPDQIVVCIFSIQPDEYNAEIQSLSTRKFTLFEGLLYYRQKEFKSVICMYTYLKLLTHTNSKKLSQVDADLVFIFLYIIYYSFTVFCHLLAKKHLETPVYDASALADKLQSPHENISNSYRCKIFFSTDD